MMIDNNNNITIIIIKMRIIIKNKNIDKHDSNTKLETLDRTSAILST